MSDNTPPNLVLITVDSLRADHCGFMGYDRDTTPVLDELAAEGIVFENAIAPGPATPESMPVAFTGQWPVERDTVDGAGLAARRERIRTHMNARETLPERLSRAGYETAAFTPNPFTSRHFGFGQGFDHFQDFMDESTRGSLYQTIFQGFLKESGLSSMMRVFMNFWQREEVFKPWESYYEAVREWVSGASEPYFLWVFLMDAHNPYMASDGYRTQSRLAEFHANVEFWRQSHETPFSESVHDRLVTAYDDAIRYSDAFLGRLRQNLDDETVVVVHGDHGEAFGEHGSYGHEPYLYPENVRIPFVMSTDAAGAVERPVSLRSLPAILEALATGDDPADAARPWTIARTRQGDRRALYTEGGYYVEGDQGEATGSMVDGADEAFRRSAAAILRRSDASLAERRRLADVAVDVGRGENA